MGARAVSIGMRQAPAHSDKTGRPSYGESTTNRETVGMCIEKRGEKWDLKSLALRVCGFESRRPHHLEIPSEIPCISTPFKPAFRFIPTTHSNKNT